jgi:hypothetical protein
MSQICHYCQKTFQTKHSLTKHQKCANYCLTLQGKNPSFNCDHCSKCFTTKGRLSCHLERCKKVKNKDEKEIDEIRQRLNRLEEIVLKDKENKNNKEIPPTQLINIITLSSRHDGYVNVLKLAGREIVEDWISEKHDLITRMENEKNIRVIDRAKPDSFWIHPELAILFAQSVSTSFSMRVGKWIRDLFQYGSVKI